MSQLVNPEVDSGKAVVVSNLLLCVVLKIENLCTGIKYLLVTEFEVSTVNYGPSFFPLIYGPSVVKP